MLNCAHCGELVSQPRGTCPYCGHDPCHDDDTVKREVEEALDEQEAERDSEDRWVDLL
jgi:predicted ATP-dependent serine protease